MSVPHWVLEHEQDNKWLWIIRRGLHVRKNVHEPKRRIVTEHYVIEEY